MQSKAKKRQLISYTIVWWKDRILCTLWNCKNNSRWLS